LRVWPAAIDRWQPWHGRWAWTHLRSSSQKPEEIAAAALDYARKHYHDVLIVDTAGRLAIDDAMMQEIRRLHGILNPIETLFVVDAMQGQDAVNVAKVFAETLPLTGVILTKLDGDSRGGAALSVRQVTGRPIKFVGVSRNSGLELFHPGYPPAFLAWRRVVAGGRGTPQRRCR
jgi:signal recognition particle subunit SRP54